MIGVNYAYVVGQKVKCWGIIGGPYPGKIVKKGTSKDCWIVRVKNRDGYRWLVELHEDHIYSLPTKADATKGDNTR